MKLEKRNCYVCPECNTVRITVHIDKGVTPMFLECIHEKCVAMARSFMYRIPPPLANSVNGNFIPTHEWYKPSEEEIKTLSEGEAEHVNRGGVLLRKRTDAKVEMYDPQKPLT